MVLTKSELEIMDVLWEAEKALSRKDLLAESNHKSWKDSSVHILLNGLLQKGAIREAGVVKCMKTYGRTFLPVITREEYYAKTIFRHRYQPDLVGIFRALLDRPEITQEQILAIEKLVAEKKKAL